MKKFVLCKSRSVTLLGMSVSNYIRKELDRYYWNKNQKEMDSPFDNSGTKYSNDYLTIRAYYWGDEEDQVALPNFEAEHIQFRWYKHSNRDFHVYVEEGYESEIYNMLADVLTKSIDSIKKDFEKE